MTKEELEREINANKFSEMKCFSADKLRNLMKEIYIDGMREGYELAISRLKFLDLIPFDSGNDYLDKNMNKIRNLINLCEQYEKCVEDEKDDIATLGNARDDFRIAFEALRDDASNLPEMSLDEINTEISASRAERKGE